MKNIKEKLMKIEFYKKPAFWIFVAITLLFFGNLYRMEFATDTYSVFTNKDMTSIEIFMRAGRFLTAIMLKVFFTLGFSDNLMYVTSFAIAIIAIIASMYRLHKIIGKHIESSKISIIVSILIILNIFIIEFMLFLEKGIMTLGILFNVLAFEQLLKVFEGKKKNIIGVLIYMLLANCSYQGTVALFVILALAYILKNSKNIKDFILKNILTALLYGIPAALSYISTRFIYKASRVSGNTQLEESITKIYQEMIKIFKNTFEIMPKWIFVTFLVMIIMIIIYKTFKQKNKLTEKGVCIGGVVYILAGTIVTSVMPQLLQDTESIWMVPRTMYAFASLAGVMMLFLCTNFKIEKWLEKLIIVLSIVYMVIQFSSFQRIIVDRYIINYEDKEIVMSIKNKIEEYELGSNNKINKLVLCYDKEVMYTYNGMFVTGDMNIKAFYPDWSAIAIMKYYIGRDFEIGEPNLEIQESFKNKNWNTYDSEQIIIQDDTIYVCVF